MPSRRKLVLLLREFQRAGHMLRGSNRVLHFRLLVKDKSLVQLLLLNASERTQWDQMATASVWPEGDAPSNDLKALLGPQTENRGQNGKTLQVLALAPPSPVLRKASRKKETKLITTEQLRRKGKVVKNADVEEQGVVEKRDQLMVQLKLDGDRMQVHITQNRKVKLFTKAGKDVTALYSNISEEIRKLCEEGDFDAHVPCIFDGELVVIHKDTEQPLPWSSTKWRYNKTESGNEKKKNNKNTSSSEAFMVLPREANGTVNNLADEEEEEDTPSFVSDSSKLEPLVETRAIANGILRIIIFDVIMHVGRAVHEQPCDNRLALLQKEFSGWLKKKCKHMRVLEDVYHVSTQDELIRLLQDTVERGQEGLVLKDPRASYHFGKSLEMQKLKLSGPEINTGVVGIGSALSGNPRMCGLLTCVAWKQGVVHSYCRVDILQGETPWKALSRVFMELESKVSVAELQEAMRGGKAVNLPEYDVRMVAVDDARYVTWKPRKPENMQYECELLIMPNDLADVQWLVSPHECLFGLSVRGDLRAVQEEEGEKTVWKPRNPVGRIELRGFQMSNLDTLSSIQLKFEEAQEVRTCVERHAIRRISELRELPAKKKRVLEIARLLQCMLGDGKKEEWPQEEPSAQPTIDSINALLREALEKYATTEASTSKKTFRELSPEERLALYNCESKVQEQAWHTLLKHGVESASEATDNAEKAAEFSKWSARLKELSQKVSTLKPVRRECGHTNAYIGDTAAVEEELGEESEWELVQEEALKEYEDMQCEMREEVFGY